MRLGQRIRNIFKFKVNDKTKFNWPELSNYCGCCKVSTGIYVRSVIIIILTLAYMCMNVIFTIHLFKRRRRVEEVIESELASDDDVDWNRPKSYFKLIVCYNIFWGAFKFFELLRNFWTMLSIYKKCPNNLKLILYIGVPCWVFDIFLSILSSIILNNLARLTLVIMSISEGYNLLAISSKYKKLTGKSRIIPEIELEPRDETNLPAIVNPPHRQLRFQTTIPALHCSTCTCATDENYNDRTSSTQNLISPSCNPELLEASETNDEIEPKTINFKEEIIVFNQEVLQERTSPIIENPGTSEINQIKRQVAIRPNTLALKSVQKVEKEKDIADTPVIYDESQLNVGSSPVVCDETSGFSNLMTDNSKILNVNNKPNVLNQKALGSSNSRIKISEPSCSNELTPEDTIRTQDLKWVEESKKEDKDVTSGICDKDQPRVNFDEKHNFPELNLR